VNPRRVLLLAAVGSLIAGCATTGPSPEARHALAPTGKLRVGINLANPVLAKRDPTTGEVNGITMDIGRMAAGRLGVDFVPVLYPNPGALVAGAREGAWDIAFAAVDPARRDVLDFTTAYMEVIVTYLVPVNSPIRTVADADRAGTRIGVGQRNAADLFLSRTLKQAQLVRVSDNLESAIDVLRSGKADLYASNREGLMQIRDKLGGYRILDERLFGVEHAIAMPNGRGPGLAYAKAFIEELKTSGVIAQLIARNSIRGVDVAPPGKQ
jgi:polar amino acid transport system substrate-binding protein